jgi:hypothetical protein
VTSLMPGLMETEFFERPDMQGGAGRVMPDSVEADRHRRIAEPGSGYDD